ncbi:hypothetical protein CDL15_Pgr022787 [Punica granatum]|nr:hypothetical protein CDL15_Pgr022787 [Punica granatum]PKI43012.1 hypothetical protein CRG98_036590 [Punica granatum]
MEFQTKSSAGPVSVSPVLLLLLMVMGQLPCLSSALQHIVGGSEWTIPPFPGFYANWSSSRRFFTGDTLYFDFEPWFYNVMQVSKLEYEACTAGNPFRAFDSSPATVLLIQEGESYFICNVSNYCSLGQKVSVIASRRSCISFPTTTSPSPAPFSPTPALSPWEPAPTERNGTGSPAPPTGPTPSTTADSHSSAGRLFHGWFIKVSFITIQLVFSLFSCGSGTILSN